MVCSSVTIGSPIMVIGHSVVNKLQGKQILALYVLAKSQWITFQYGLDRHIVIQQTQLVLWKVFWFAVAYGGAHHMSLHLPSEHTFRVFSKQDR
jgi:hypothetical protein